MPEPYRPVKNQITPSQLNIDSAVTVINFLIGWFKLDIQGKDTTRFLHQHCHKENETKEFAPLIKCHPLTFLHSVGTQFVLCWAHNSNISNRLITESICLRQWGTINVQPCKWRHQSNQYHGKSDVNIQVGNQCSAMVLNRTSCNSVTNPMGLEVYPISHKTRQTVWIIIPFVCFCHGQKSATERSWCLLVSKVLKTLAKCISGMDLL